MFYFHFIVVFCQDRLDLSRVAFAGHSFGGSTLVAALGNDERFKYVLERKNMSRGMIKPTKLPVRPAKTQISLGIRPV